MKWVVLVAIIGSVGAVGLVCQYCGPGGYLERVCDICQLIGSM